MSLLFFLWNSFFIIYQSLLFHAAYIGNKEFVNFLLNINDNQDIISPIALFDPCLSPLIASIEQDHFDITSLLLSYGIDPNSQTPYDQYITLDLTDSLTDNQETQQPTFLTPLDIAISKRKGRTVSLLITCGADVKQINQKNISINMKKQLDKYKEEISSTDKFNLKGKLNQINEETKKYAQITKSILSELQQIDNFTQVQSMPIVTKIQEHYTLTNTNINNIVQVADRIKEKRGRYLKSQFDQLIQDDRSILKTEIEKDKQQWIATYDEAIKLLQSQLRNKKTKSYAFECLSRIKDEKDKFLRKSNDLIEVSNVEQKNFRLTLLKYNSFYGDLKMILNDMCLIIKSFHEQSIKTLNGFLEIIHQQLDTIHEINDPNSNAMKRLCFPDSIIAAIKTENESKEKILQQTLTEIEDQKVHYEQSYRKFRNCLLSYMC